MAVKENSTIHRILVIDDNAAIHEDFQKILANHQDRDDTLSDMESAIFGIEERHSKLDHFQIDTAFQGQEGLDMIQQALVQERPYALVFVDGRMPPGWDGIETIRHLWKACPDLQIVLCTAYADYSWQEIQQALGKTDNLLMLKKPFDNAEVLQMAYTLTRKWELGHQVKAKIENLDSMVKAQMKEKEKALSQAAEAEKQALVGQIAGKLAHDFNNVLGAIMGNSELALLDCKHEETRKRLNLILEQTLRGKNMTRNLVAFARDQEPRQENISMPRIIDMVLALMKRDLEGIQVICNIEDDLPDFLADPGMVEHALVNLIQNAIHAVAKNPQPEISIRASYEKNRIMIAIHDNGCGIPSESMEHVFTPSFTLKGSKDRRGLYKSGIKGTGYGMCNVKQYVEQHHGDLFIQSELHKGTCVTMHLPVSKKKMPRLVKKELEQETTHSGKHILVVEDEDMISEIQYQILTSKPHEYRVDVASDGHAAKNLLRSNRYDLVSLDYILPENITGMDIYHDIRSLDKTIPILFMSGNIEFLESIKELRHKDPYVSHLAKPCRNSEYVGRINKLLGMQ